MVTPVRYGPEFLVNSTTNNDQFTPSITGLSNGRFVVTFSDNSGNLPDQSGSNTRAQIFNADGSKFGTEFLANDVRSGSQFESQVTALSNGRFAVTYVDTSINQTGVDQADVRVQVFNADGTKSGEEFIAPAASTDAQSIPVIAGLNQGRYVVVWLDNGLSSQQTIRAQTFNADGTKFGAEHQINTAGVGFPSDPTVTGLANGDYVVAWNSQSVNADSVVIYSVNAQLFHADGTIASTQYVGNTVAGNSQAELAPSVTGLEGGGFVLTWTEVTVFDNNVDARVFDAAGSAVTGKFLVNTTTLNSQDDSAVASLADGGFVVVWTDSGTWDGISFKPDIHAQAYHADGSVNGLEVLVNTDTTSIQREATVTGLADGRFVVSWTDLSGGPGDTTFAVRAQIFDARDAAINLTGTAGSDSYVGTRFNDTLAGANGDDVLKGGAGADRISGGLGKDVLTGGAGADVFVFANAAQAGTGANRDRITDFAHGIDHINLHAFMAGGHFLGGDAFVAGDGPQLRYDAAAGNLQGDVTGDGLADFGIKLDGAPLLTAGDFIF